MSDVGGKPEAPAAELINSLGRELAQHTDLTQLIPVAVRVLDEHFPNDGVAVWVVSREGESTCIFRSGTAPPSPPTVLALGTPGETVGRIELWRRPGAGSTGLLEALGPWLSIAFANARNFDRQREVREALERKADERMAQLRLLLEQVTELDRQRTEFFANASHELRTPLSLILGPLESVLQSATLAETVRDELGTVLRSAYRLSKVVNDLVDLSKIEAGSMVLRTGPTDLSRVLAEAVQPWRTPLKQRGVELVVSLPPAVLIIADAERLEQVALNLLAHAAKHTPDGGRIAIRLNAGAGGEVSFSVENTGDPIPASELPTIFERFSQPSGPEGRGQGPAGLDLPGVRDLVELHGGRVAVESEVGKPVVFTVTLPRGTTPQAGPDRAAPQASASELNQDRVAGERGQPGGSLAPVETSSGLPRLLVVEDTAELRHFLVRSLRKEFEILEAEDGKRGLELARRTLPDIILSDWMMPEMDGLELCQALRADPLTATVPFILLTARGDVDAKVRGIGAGADDYIVKPFQVSEVKVRLRAQLRLRSLTERLNQAEKLAALGTLVAGVAHEIRNPLNGLINALEPLRDMLPKDAPELKELVDISMEGARRVDRISTQLLQQARAGEGEMGEVDLRENIGLALQLLAHKVEKGPSMEFHHPDGGVRVLGEPGALHQVWINLIDNAIQAAGPSGRVVATLSAQGELACVEVADNGPGIEPRVARRIFDPFFTTKPVGKGTGLGLSLVREIVTKHHGTVSVSSKPGEGARFRVLVPRLQGGSDRALGALARTVSAPGAAPTPVGEK